MASIQPADQEVELGAQAPGAQAPGTQIWGNDERGCRGKMTRPRVIGLGVVVLCAALALGLYFGLAGSGGDSVDQIVGQSIDPNAIGCFVDERRDRVAMDVMVDEAMTPQVSALGRLYLVYRVASGAQGGVVGKVEGGVYLQLAGQHDV